MRYLVFLLIVLSSCASNKANRKLKRANKLIAQAEQLGAKWHSDTVKTKFKFEGAKASFNWNVVLNRKESTRDRVVLKDTVLYINKIKVEKRDSLIYIECPEVEGEVATAINKEIKTGLGILTVVQWSVLALLIGAVLARILWK